MNKSSIKERRSTRAKHSRSRLRRFRLRAPALVFALTSASAIACSSSTPSAQISDERDQDGGSASDKNPPNKPRADEASLAFSTAELMLRTTDGVYLNQFSFQIKNAAGELIEDRTFSVPGVGTQTKLALELPVATDYAIVVTGQGTLGTSTYPCAGEAPFNVVKDQLTSVDLDIECVVPVTEQSESGGVEITATIVTVSPFVGECGIDGLIVGPLTVSPGGFITAQGTAVPTTSAFTWTASVGLYGTFTDAAAGNDVVTRFRCFGGSGNIVLTVSSDLCTDQFSVPVSCGPAGECGDGIIQTFRGEVCDDGNTADGDACTSECTVPAICGDGIVQEGEPCDDGNQVDDDTCRNDCTPNSCGDGTVQSEFGEQCDDANTADNDGCSGLCVIERCGDNTLQAARGELCDDGNTLSGDGCNAGCFIEYCGDGVVQPGLGERCDSSPGCGAECTYLAVCGDGELGPGEMCDDGETVDGDGCSATCVSESCGDGALQVTLGEDCDDGNTVDGDGCTSTCVRELCGDATLNNGEGCDDGNTTNGDGCSETCQTEVPSGSSGSDAGSPDAG